MSSSNDSVVKKLSKHDNPALHVTPDHQLSLEAVPIPTPSPSQVLIHVRCTGICGSDLHLWHKGNIGALHVTKPSILGHEASGVIIQTGSSVTNLKPGDRVAIEPGISCGTCFLCTSGQYNNCESVKFAGVCPHPGTLRRFMTHESRYCHKIPPTMTFSQAALVEPLSVILHAISLCNGSVSIGRPALICGAGPIGLITLSALSKSGAWPLAITDVEESRLEFAKRLVPGVQTYLVVPSKSPLECAEEIGKIYGCGRRNLETDLPAENEHDAPSTVFECTGVESSIATACYTCRRGGTVMVIGISSKGKLDNLPFMHLNVSEIQLRFSNRYNNTWPAGINALTNHSVLNLDGLVTHRFKLEESVKALECAADRGEGAIKVHVFDDVDVEIE